MTEEVFLISELARKAGVSVRTIRYYIDQGLLPASTTRGRYAHFNREHLQLLELIKKLKSIHLPLEEIKQILDATGEEDIPRLMNRLELPERNAISVDTDMPAEAPGKAALEYISDLTSKRSVVQESRPSMDFSVRAFKLNYPAKKPPFVSAAQTWVRLTLALGVELSYQTPNDPETERRIQELVKFAQSLFRRE